MAGRYSLVFIRSLLCQHRGMLLLVLAAGAFSGLFSAAVVAVINSLLHPHEDRTGWLAVGFIGLVSGKLVANVLSQLWLVRFVQDAIIEVTVALCEKILRSSLRMIERAGTDEIFTILTDDVGSVVWAAQCFPNLSMNTAVVAGCGLYLLWLSPFVFLGVVGVTGAGAVGYYWLHRRSISAVHAARDAKAKMFQQFRGVTGGIKELLMSTERGRLFLAEDVHETVVTLRRNNLAAFRHQLLGESWTQLLYYLLIGLLLLVFPAVLPLTQESLTGFVFAMLYLMNPVWAVIGSLPAVIRGQIAMSRIQALGISFDTLNMEVAGEPEQASSPLPVVLSITQVTFRYEADRNQEGFTLGPLDFTIRSGELVFIVGGNGSGKSTFVKLLSGLYAPEKGSVMIGPVAVTEQNRRWYRQHFSVVFSDYHLFDRLYGVRGSAADMTVRKYLTLLELDGRVTFHDGRFSTQNLSQGQRRRLALIAAYMEDRPIYVFDEWAADQDPHYKGVFYNKILPDLCERGKAVVVITHDDRYYHLGDRVIKLDDGRIAKAWCPKLDRTAHAGT